MPTPSYAYEAMDGHFSGSERPYKVLSRHWWWQGMYGDILTHYKSCSRCATVNTSGKINSRMCIYSK